MLTVHIASAAIAAPGLDGWEDAAAVLCGKSPYQPEAMRRYAPEGRPATERRRRSKSTRWAVHVSEEAVAARGPATEKMAVIFASANGDGDIADQICEALASPMRMVSPTRFHNSVHNAPAGYWSIATGARTPSTSLAGYDATFAAALMAASAQVIGEEIPVLLALYDLPFPDPLNEKRPMKYPFAAALVLTPQPTDSGLGSIDVRFAASDAPVSTMADSALETLRSDNPAAQILPLLAGLARREATRIVVGHGETHRLGVEYRP